MNRQQHPGGTTDAQRMRRHRRWRHRWMTPLGLVLVLAMLSAGMHWFDPDRVPVLARQVWEFAAALLGDAPERSAEVHAVETSIHVQESRPSRAIEHLPPPPAECLADTAREVDTVQHRVYRWVDGDGITHYSDRAPAAPSADPVEILMRDEQLVRITAQAVGAAKPAGYLERARIDAVAISKVFRDVLDVPADGRLVLDLTFVGSQPGFAELVGQDHLANSQGVYIPADRKVLVRIQRNEALTFSVLRHEITHALVHEWVGRLPVAMNEGLAEYFERFRVEGLGGHSDLSRVGNRVRKAAPAGGAESELRRLLRLSPREFYSPERDRHYTRSLALVAVLMGDQPGRDVLGRVARAQRADTCRPVDVARILGRHYPGGLGALAGKWQRSMQDGELPGVQL